VIIKNKFYLYCPCCSELLNIVAPNHLEEVGKDVWIYYWCVECDTMWRGIFNYQELITLEQMHWEDWMGEIEEYHPDVDIYRLEQELYRIKEEQERNKNRGIRK